MQPEKISHTGAGVGGRGGVAAGRVMKAVIGAGNLAQVEAVGKCVEVTARSLAG